MYQISSFEPEDDELEHPFDVKGQGWSPDGILAVIDTVMAAKSADEAEDKLITELEALGWHDIAVRARRNRKRDKRRVIRLPKDHVSRGVI